MLSRKYFEANFKIVYSFLDLVNVSALQCFRMWMPSCFFVTFTFGKRKSSWAEKDWCDPDLVWSKRKYPVLKRRSFAYYAWGLKKGPPCIFRTAYNDGLAIYAMELLLVEHFTTNDELWTLDVDLVHTVWCTGPVQSSRPPQELSR